jgi:hypothetical protein
MPFEYIHGHAKPKQSPTYLSWVAMKQRCTNPKHENFKYYGARGVTVCDRWLTFANFLADMGEKPPDKTWKGTHILYTIDRWPDPNGNYEPNNCRWATHKQQRANLRVNPGG